MKIDSKHLSYTYSTDGYTILYKGNCIGGASVKLPREKSLHWRHARANREEFKQIAQTTIANIASGRIDTHYLKAIEEIDNAK